MLCAAAESVGVLQDAVGMSHALAFYSSLDGVFCAIRLFTLFISLLLLLLSSCRRRRRQMVSNVVKCCPCCSNCNCFWVFVVFAFASPDSITSNTGVDKVVLVSLVLTKQKATKKLLNKHQDAHEGNQTNVAHCREARL